VVCVRNEYWSANAPTNSLPSSDFYLSKRRRSLSIQTLRRSLGVERLRPKLYCSEVNELLKHPAESSAFIGHARLLSAGCRNLRDSVPLIYTRATSDEFRVVNRSTRNQAVLVRLHAPVVRVSESLSSVIGESILTAAARIDVTAVVEASTGPINRDWMIVNLPSDCHDVQRAVFSKRFENLAFSLVSVHATATTLFCT
jgi:hypothetical protein